MLLWPHHTSISFNKTLILKEKTKSLVINMTCNIIQGMLVCCLIPIPSAHVCCRDCFWFALWNIYIRV